MNSNAVVQGGWPSLTKNDDLHVTCCCRCRTTEQEGLLQVSNSSSVRVLVVEDNPINQRIAVLLLQKLGLNAEIANDGPSALDMIQKAQEEAPYDIVLMDIQMPKMSGWEAATKIRSLCLPHPPLIIAVTAATTVSDRDRSLAYMDDFVSKPISLDCVRDAIVRAWPKSGRPPLFFPSKNSSAGSILRQHSADALSKPQDISTRAPSDPLPLRSSGVLSKFSVSLVLLSIIIVLCGTIAVLTKLCDSAHSIFYTTVHR